MSQGMPANLVSAIKKIYSNSSRCARTETVTTAGPLSILVYNRVVSFVLFCLLLLLIWLYTAIKMRDFPWKGSGRYSAFDVADDNAAVTDNVNTTMTTTILFMHAPAILRVNKTLSAPATDVSSSFPEAMGAVAGVAMMVAVMVFVWWRWWHRLLFCFRPQPKRGE